MATVHDLLAYVALTSQSNYVAADVTMVSNATFYDGPSLTLAAGTWLLVGAVRLDGGNTSNRTWAVKLWDGTTIYSSGNHVSEGTAQAPSMTIPASAVVTPGSSTTYKISASTTINGSIDKIATGSSNKASWLIAVRIG